MALAAAAAGLLAVAPATASAGSRGATMFVLSADSGELHSGSLTLRGVGRRVTWATHAGRSGSSPPHGCTGGCFCARCLRPPGPFHVAGKRSGRDLTFRLHRARYDASRQRVRYRVKRLNKHSRPRRGSGASQSSAPRGFGPATLSIVHAPSAVGGSSAGGKVCATFISIEPTPYAFQALDWRKWNPTPGTPIDKGGIKDVWYCSLTAASSRLLELCLFQLASAPDDPVPPPLVTIEFAHVLVLVGRPRLRLRLVGPREVLCEQCLPQTRSLEDSGKGSVTAAGLVVVPGPRCHTAACRLDLPHGSREER